MKGLGFLYPKVKLNEANVWPESLILLLLTRNASHCGLAIYIKKFLKTKEELWKLKYFTMQKYNLQNNPLKETQILQDSITNLKFGHKPKYHLSKILI
jgi:hypothetical protein